jgi:hypothetical protein
MLVISIASVQGEPNAMYLLASALEEIADEEIAFGATAATDTVPATQTNPNTNNFTTTFDGDDEEDEGEDSEIGVNKCGRDTKTSLTNVNNLRQCSCGECQHMSLSNAFEAVYWMARAAAQTTDENIARRAEPHVQRLRTKFPN